MWSTWSSAMCWKWRKTVALQKPSDPQQLGSRRTPLANAAAVATTVGVWQSVMSMPAEAYSDDIYSSSSESWRSLDRENVVGITMSKRSNGRSNSSNDCTAAASSWFSFSFYSLWSKIKSCRSLPRSRSSLVEQQKSAIGRSSTSSSSLHYSSSNSSPQSHFHLQFHSDTTHPILGLPLNWVCIFTSSKFLVWVLSRVGRLSSLAG